MIQKCLLALFLVLMLASRSRAQSGTIEFRAEATHVKPGDVITLNWKVDHFSNLDHVTIEMTHLALSTAVIFNDLPPEGTLDVLIPADYFDQASLKLYPEDVIDRRFRDDAGGIIFDEIELTIDDGIEVISFTAEPNPAERGGTVTISWEITGAAADQIGYFEYAIPDRTNAFYERITFEGSVGSITLAVPDFYTEIFSIGLWTDKVMSGNTLNIDITCPFADHLAPMCPYTQEERRLLYQQIERGLLIFDQDSHVWFVGMDEAQFYFESYWGEDDAETVEEVGREIPAGFFPISPEFSEWTDNRGIEWATSEPQFYTTFIETVPESSGRYYNQQGLYLYLPSGELIHADPMTMGWEYAEKE